MFASGLCFNMGVLYFPDDVNGVLMVMKADQAEQRIAESNNITGFDLMDGVFNDFEDGLSFR